MSMRRQWTINGKHFAETRTERGGLRFFIDGRPTREQDWAIAIAEAQRADPSIGGRFKPEPAA